MVHLGCFGTQADIRRQGLVLREGRPVRFFEDDRDVGGRLDPLVADGTVRLNPRTGRWEAGVGQVRPESALANIPDHWCHQIDWTAEASARRASWQSGRRGRRTGDGAVRGVPCSIPPLSTWAAPP
jgi:hypothetical protein